MKALRNTAFAFLGLLAVLVICGYFIGGGIGEQESLPGVLRNTSAPLLIAHRGAVSNVEGIPENSRSAIARALQRGYRWVEIDVQVSADGQFFVFHDANGKRLSGKDTTLYELTLSEITQIALKTDSGNAETVPALDDIVGEFKDSLCFFFDIKLYDNPSHFERAKDIAEFLEKHELTDCSIVGSESLMFIACLEHDYPAITTLLETSSLNEMKWVDRLPRLFKPDMYANYRRYVSSELAEWIVDREFQRRFIAFHVARISFDDVRTLGVTQFMIDDAPYLDTYLPNNRSKLKH